MAETVALAADADTQLHKTMREVQRRIAHSTREREHAQICDLFQSIDTDGSGRLEWEEVSEGAAKLGAGNKAGQEQLRLLFSQVADEWREVDRKQFDFLLSSLKAAQQFGSAYVLEAAEVMQTMRRELDHVQALRRASGPGTLPGGGAPGTFEKSTGKLRYAANTSTAAVGGRGGAAMPSIPAVQPRGGEAGCQQAYQALMSASQKLSRLAYHGTAAERERRQAYLAQQGAVTLCVRMLALCDSAGPALDDSGGKRDAGGAVGDSIFWAAQALLALVMFFVFVFGRLRLVLCPPWDSLCVCTVHLSVHGCMNVHGFHACRSAIALGAVPACGQLPSVCLCACIHAYCTCE